MADEARADPSSAADEHGVTPEPSPSSPDVKTLEDAIRNAIEPPEAAQQQSEKPAEGETAPSAVEEQSEPASAGAALESDDELIERMRASDVPLGKIKRFTQALADAKHHRDRADQLEGRFAEIEVSARRAGMTNEEVIAFYSFFPAAAEDPAKALATLTAFRDSFAQRIGEAIPPDLRERIEQGEIDAPTAQRLARAEAQVQRERQLAEERENESRVRAAAEVRSRNERAVNDYERTLRESDPDYGKKHEFVKRELVLLAGQRFPQTPEEALALAKQAYTNVNRQLAALMPAPRAARTIAGRSSPAPASVEPSTMMEAIERALETAS